jgi:BMFP domain-containing protein YqiC
MTSENRLFEDLSRVASGAFTALSGVRDEVESRLREQVEKALSRLNLVTREEFDAVQAMAQRARIEQEALEARLAALELRLAAETVAPAAETGPLATE